MVRNFSHGVIEKPKRVVPSQILPPSKIDEGIGVCTFSQKCFSAPMSGIYDRPPVESNINSKKKTVTELLVSALSFALFTNLDFIIYFIIYGSVRLSASLRRYHFSSPPPSFPSSSIKETLSLVQSLRETSAWEKWPTYSW